MHMPDDVKQELKEYLQSVDEHLPVLNQPDRLAALRTLESQLAEALARQCDRRDATLSDVVVVLAKFGTPARRAKLLFDSMLQSSREAARPSPRIELSTTPQRPAVTTPRAAAQPAASAGAQEDGLAETAQPVPQRAAGQEPMPQQAPQAHSAPVAQPAASMPVSAPADSDSAPRGWASRFKARCTVGVISSNCPQLPDGMYRAVATPEGLSLAPVFGGQAMGVIPPCCQVQRMAPWKLAVSWQQFRLQLQLTYVPLKRITRLADDLEQYLRGARPMLYAKDYGVPPAVAVGALLPSLPLLVLWATQQKPWWMWWPPFFISFFLITLFATFDRLSAATRRVLCGVVAAAALGGFTLQIASDAFTWNFGSGSSVRHSTPRQYVETAFAARDKGDVEAMVQLTHPDYQAGARVAARIFDIIPRLKSTYNDLFDAVEKNYGRRTSELQQDMIIQQLDDLKDSLAGEIKQVYTNGKVDWPKVSISVKGDAAIIRFPGQREPWKIVKVRGLWYELDETQSPQQLEEHVRSMTARFEGFLADLKRITSRIRSGSYTEQQMRQELHAAVAALEGEAALKGQAAPQPAKPLFAGVAEAVTAMNGSDESRKDAAIQWLNEQQIPIQHVDSICSLAARMRPDATTSRRVELARLACRLARAKDAPHVEVLARSQERGEWEPAIPALYKVAPDAARRVVMERASDWGTRMLVERLFLREPDAYADEPALLLASSNPDLQAQMVGILSRVGRQKDMQALRDLKARLGDDPGGAGVVRAADDALRQIRRRLLDRGISVPPEPVVPTPTPIAGATPTPRPKVADLDSALAALKSGEGNRQAEGLRWLEKATLSDPTEIARALAAIKELRAAAANVLIKAQLDQQFIRLAGAGDVDDVVALARGKEGAYWVPAMRKLYKLDAAKAQNVVEERAEDFFFRSAVFKEFDSDAATYEPQMILHLLRTTSTDLRGQCIKSLGQVGTTKAIVPLQTVRRRLNTLKNGGVIREIDQAVQAIQRRTQYAPSPLPASRPAVP